MRLGADISHWAGKTNFSTMKNAGVEFCWIKAGQGSWKDSMFVENRDNSRGIIPRGAYWYFDSNYTPQAQAQAFYDAVADDPMELPLVIDYEENYGGSYGGWQKLYTMIVGLEELLPDKKIMIYTGYWYWKDHSPQGFWQKSSLEWFKKYNLWMAAYNNRPPEDQNVPAPWDEILVWQYTQSGDGETYGVTAKDVDLNYFLGTDEQWTEFIDDVDYPPTEPPTEPPTGEEEMIAEAINRLTSAVIGTGKDTVDAIEGLDISVPPTNPPTEPPTTPLDWSNIEVRANPDNYPRRWELDSTANNDVNIPFFRNNDVTDSKIILWDGVIVKEHLPPSKYWGNSSELMNILNEFAWVRAFNVQKPANGKWFHMPTAFITTAGKVCDNWYGGAFVRRVDLKAA